MLSFKYYELAINYEFHSEFNLKFLWDTLSILNNFLFKFYLFYLSILFLDISNQANLLLINLKEIIEKLQSEKNYFKTQVEKLQIEKKQLITSNKNLSNELYCLKEDLKRKVSQ